MVYRNYNRRSRVNKDHIIEKVYTQLRFSNKKREKKKQTKIKKQKTKKGAKSNFDANSLSLSSNDRVRILAPVLRRRGA